MNTPTCELVLYNIRSIHNVGSLFRTADAAGVERLHLVGYTPSPVDRFGRERSDVAKVALGAEKNVPWIQSDSILETINDLKRSGYHIVALEQDSHSIDYKVFETPEKVALILGNEPDGVPEEVLNECDTIIEIPMKGKKESLNVSVAGGVALYRLLDT